MAISVGMGECPASPYLSLSLLSIPSLPSLPQLSLLISPSLLLYPPTPALLAPHHLHPDIHTHTPSPNFSFSQQGSSGHCSLSTHPQPPHNTHPHTTTSSAPPHPLFLSERMFQPLHTDSSGILCVEMFLLDPQALTIYRTKASAPLLKAWHLWPCAYTSDLSLWQIFLSSQLTDAPVFKRCLTDTTLTVVKVNAMQYMLWLANNKEINK